MLLSEMFAEVTKCSNQNLMVSNNIIIIPYKVEAMRICLVAASFLAFAGLRVKVGIYNLTSCTCATLNNWQNLSKTKMLEIRN